MGAVFSFSSPQEYRGAPSQFPLLAWASTSGHLLREARPDAHPRVRGPIHILMPLTFFPGGTVFH